MSLKRWTALADGLVEACLYLVVLLTPVLVDVNLQRIFALPKVSLIRLLAIIVLAAWAFKGVVALRARQPLQPHRLLHQPLAWPILASVVALVVGTAVSILPQASVWGGFLRIQGLWTTLSYVVLAVAAMVILRRQTQVERVIDLALLASWPVALYGVMQVTGLDPITWQNYTGRILSTLGNPVFLGAYIAILFPLTVYRCATLWTSYQTNRQQVTLVGLVWTGALLVAQVLVLVLSQSRGPLLALLVELFFLLVLLTRRRAVVMSFFALAFGGLTLLALINVPGGPLASVRRLPVVGRLTNLTDDQYRGVIWARVSRLLGADPLRVMTGYGPEALDVALMPYYTYELAYLGGQAQQIDRTHNLLLESQFSSGVLGSVTTVWLLLAALTLGLEGLGLLATRSQRGMAVALPLLGGLALALVARAATGGWTWSALFGGLGVALGWGIALWILTSRASGETALPPTERLLVSALLVSLLGQFIEGQFSPGTEIVLLYGWLVIALLVVVTRGWSPAPGADAVLETRRVAGRAQVTVSGDTLSATAQAVLIGLLLSLLTVGLIDWTPPFNLDRHVWAVLGVAAMTAGLAYVWSFWRGEGMAGGLWPIVYLSLSLTFSVLTLYIMGQFVSLVILPLLLVYALVLAAVGYLAYSLAPASERGAGSGELVPAAALALMAVAGIALLSYLPMVSDRYFALGRRLYSQGQATRGLDMLARARQANPDQDILYVVSSDILSKLASSLSDVAQQTATFERARTLAQQAVALKPGQPYNVANLAHIELRWAETVTAPTIKTAAIQRGLDLHERMAATMTFDPAVYDDWGYLLHLKGDYPGAIVKFNAALKLIPSRGQSLILRGRSQTAMGLLAEAEQSYRAATVYDKLKLDAYVELSELLMQQGRAKDALPFAEEVVKLAPDRYPLRHNLALVYSKLGRTSEAAEEIRVALRYAPPTEESKLRALLQQLGGTP